jgi:hypothetical protein
MAWPLPPVAICTSCGTITSNAGAINNPCSHHGCGGCFCSAMAQGDWEKCRYCDGSGWKDGAACGPCQGSGWGFIRDGRHY